MQFDPQMMSSSAGSVPALSAAGGRERQTNRSAACVHELFEEQVRQAPDRIALMYGNESLTYYELNCRANVLAAHLESMGVGAETLVGVALKRSPDLIISLLAVLKAGGAYLPLDANYPQQRLDMMIEDARPPLIITESSFTATLPGFARQLCLDAISLSGKALPNPVCRANANSLAYVMFTSGSTGQPNGVMIEHRSIVRLVKGTDYADFSPDNVFLQFAPITFDASTFEIWGALLNGGRLAIMPESTTSLADLENAIRDYGVTTLWLTAGLFQLVVDERIEALRPLRQLLAGGDVLSVPHVAKVLKTLDCDLINGYGPTENTTFTCCYKIPRAAQLVSSVPIGRPISGTEVYILDENLRQVPRGEIGELYLGGEGLARGYLNRPALTASRFVPGPDPEMPSPRLYRSGDLGRFLPDGTIEFLGRADQQVKIRGFRVELEEIQLALTDFPLICEAAVVARDISAADKQLVAFIVCAEGEQPEICKVRSYLAERLPDYMIPAFILPIDRLPLNPNGKVDRRALIEMIPGGPTRTATFCAPETQNERRVSEIVAAVLGTGPISLLDNFFDLGANSLQLVRVHAQLQQTVDRNLKIVTLYQNPTVKSLASHLERATEGIATARIEDRAAKQRTAFARRKPLNHAL